MIEEMVKSNKSEQAKKLGFPRDNGLKKPIGSAKGGFRTSRPKAQLYSRAQIRVTGISVVCALTETKYAGVPLDCKEHLGNRLPGDGRCNDRRRAVQVDWQRRCATPLGKISDVTSRCRVGP
jgi:hypothetical protein